MPNPKKSTKPTDKERLDWLTNHEAPQPIGKEYDRKEGRYDKWWAWGQKTGKEHFGDTPREAIDAAMKAEITMRAAERRDKKKARG